MLTTIDDVQNWLIEQVAKSSGLAKHEILVDQTFSAVGIDSISLIRIVKELSHALERELPASLPFAHPTPGELARAVIAGPTGVQGSGARSTQGEPPRELAIVGMGCRFPSARGLQDFWRLLRDGSDAIRPFCPDRAVAAGATGRDVGWAGTLDDVAGFDPEFFGISRREAVEMDPQQRLALEVTWEALEDAGVVPSMLKHTRVGVFAGAMWNDYAVLTAGSPDAYQQHTATGNDTSIIAARISYALGLHGPSLTVNTACSSSLVALHLACQALALDECDTAIVLGVNLLLAPDSTIAMTRFGGLSPDGRCFTFDARANGYVRGEGCGVVILRKLDDALRDAQRIDAVVLGSAVNNDGASNGLTAPNPDAQRDVLQTACARAGVAPSRIQYVEAHGTGTFLGDPIEVGAIGAVYGTAEGRVQPVHIGSVKSNIGHLESAAGVAGVIKTVLAMRHGQLPPSLHFDTPNPQIAFDALNVRVQSQLGPWPGDGKRIAAVSAFGFGGTNCHVVLRSFGEPAQPVVPIAARTLDGLRIASLDALSVLERDPATLRALQSGERASDNGMLHYRAVLHASSREELVGALDALSSSSRESSHVAIGRVVGARLPTFVYCGQGAQWLGMARTALADGSAFARALRLCDVPFQTRHGRSLLALLAHDDASWHLRPELLWPTTVALGIALTEQLRADGVQPGSVIGHSIGEITAAWACGALSLEDAMHVALAQGAAIARPAGAGAMLFVALSWDAAQARAADVHCAVRAAPQQTVLAGPRETLAALARELEAEGVFTQFVQGNVAAHAPTLGMTAELRAELATLRPRAATVPFFSAVTGTAVEGSRLDAAYWATHFSAPVLFEDSVRSAATSCEARLFLEVGAHPILRRALDATVRAVGASCEIIPTLSRGRSLAVSLRDARTSLYLAGAPVRWSTPATTTLLPLSARTPAALAMQVRGTERALDALHGDAQLSSFLHTVSLRRTHFEERAVVCVDDADSLRSTLAELARAPEAAHPSVVRGRALARPEVTFAFSGQGSQWPQMWHSLDELPEASAVLMQCESIFASLTGTSLRAVVEEPAETSRLAHTEFAQPALVATQLALAAHWRSLGVRPAAVIGHSVGEVAAACVAGCLDVPAAMQLVVQRAKAMGNSTAGMMISCEASAETLREHLRDVWSELDVAAFNGPSSTVLSGDPAWIARARERLEGLGVSVKLVNERYAFHGRAMDTAAEELFTMLRGEEEREPACAMYSTVTGARLDAIGGSYWARNVRQPVCFAQALRSALEDGHLLFLEIGPHPVLLRDMRQAGDAVAVASLRRQRPARAALQRAAAELHVHGVQLDWSRLAPHGAPSSYVPTYSWQHKPYWRPRAHRSHAPTDRLLNVPEYLRDHVVGDAPIVPGAWYIEQASTLAEEIPFALTDVSFPAVLPVESDREVRLHIREQSAGRTVLRIESRKTGEASTPHADLTLVKLDAAPGTPDLGAWRLRCTELRDRRTHYRAMERRGLRYAAAFQVVESIALAEDAATARFTLSDTLAASSFQPVTLDAALQTYMALTPADGTLRVPARAACIRMHAALPRTGWILAERDASGLGQLALLDDAGKLCASIDGLSVAKVGEVPTDPLDRLLYEEQWVAGARDVEPLHEQTRFIVIGDRAGFSALVTHDLRARGHAVIEVDSGYRHATARYRIDPRDSRSWRALVRDVGEGSHDVFVDLSLLDEVEDHDDPARAITMPALGLCQALLGSGWRDLPRVVWVTRGVHGASSAASALRAPVWALARVVALEHPELATRCIDLAAPDARDASTVCDELLRADDEEQVVLRDGQRLVARLRPATSSETTATIRRDGTYVLCGGLGGLGLTLARWLAERGAGHLVLCGRTAPDNDTRAAVEALGEGRVTLAQADVTDRTALERMFDALRASDAPPVRGIFLLAGVLDDATVLEQDHARFARVMAPKVRGARNLHDLSEGLPLDHFVLFSSVASLIGLPGQANYAAANGYLDALAHARREAGLPALSLQWGPFSHVGMAAASEQRGTRLARRGLRSIPPVRLGEVLDRCLGDERAQLAVMDLDVRQWCEFHAHLASAPFWSSLRTSSEPPPQASELAASLRALGTTRARPQLRELLIKEFTLVMQTPASELDWSRSFGNLGMDSLMSLELRNRLEAQLGAKLGPTLLFAYPTLDALQEHLLDGLLATSEPARAFDDTAHENFAVEISDDALEAMSEDEAARLLSQTIAAMELGGEA